MPNIDNLIPFTEMTPSQHRELSIKGQKASTEAKRKKKTMKEVLAKMLDEVNPGSKTGLTNRELATLGLIKGATLGNSRNYQVIMALTGELEKEKTDEKKLIYIPASDIGSAFVDVNRDIDERKHREYYFKGGRGSTKSSYISEKIIELIWNNENFCAVIMRKVKDTLKDSVFQQIEWAIDKLSETFPFVKEDFKLTKNPLEITRISTGQKIYFRGADDYGKIKSLKPPANMYTAIEWYEEFDQLNGMNEVRKINQSLERGGEDFILFYSYNTPASINHFVNQEELVPKATRYIHLSDYRAVPEEWLGRPFIEEAEWLKGINEKLYNNEYLGIATGTGGNVFENLELREISDEEINTFDYNYQGIDFGWFPDPFAWTKCHYNPSQRAIYIYDEMILNKVSNEDVWHKLTTEKGVTTEDLIIADSAEPKSIGDFKSYGACIKPAEKGPGSVDYSMKWLASRSKIVIDPNRCPVSAKEFTNYEFEKDKDDNFISGYVDADNHCIDSIRYALNNIWKKKGQ